MIAAIMQPTFLPWIGYFDLVDRVDAFIILDDVKFSRQSWQQRNRIKTQQGLMWLSLPVDSSERDGTSIREARVGAAARPDKMIRALTMNYSRAPAFAAVFPAVAAWMESISPGDSLAETNIRFITLACRMLGIAAPTLVSSALPARPDRCTRLVDLCRSVGADSYLSPLGAAPYLQDGLAEFHAAGIDVAYHGYEHPTYSQLYPPFLPYCSVLDLLLNEGANSLAVLRSGRRPSLRPEEIPCP